MRIIGQSTQIQRISAEGLVDIERAGRTCWKSEGRKSIGSDITFVNNMLKRGHFAMIEFADMTVKCVTNRGVSHEIVRHRLFSFAQESTRYISYKNEVEFICPVWCNSDIKGQYPQLLNTPSNIPSVLMTNPEDIFIDNLRVSESYYRNLLKEGWRPEQAREILPNALKTEIVMKANFRNWLHFFSLRNSKKAHPQMQLLASDIYQKFTTLFPVFKGQMITSFISDTQS